MTVVTGWARAFVYVLTDLSGEAPRWRRTRSGRELKERAMIRTFSPEKPGTAMLRVFGASLLALALPLGANTARADPACASHEAVSNQLEQRYAEVPIAMGLENNGKLVQVFASADGVSWTLVLTQPDGTSCIAASGRYWQTVTEKKLGPEA